MLRYKFSTKSRSSAEGETTDEQMMSKGGIKSLIKQAKFEEHLVRKIEEMIANSHRNGDRFDKGVTQRELELQIELLKRENERVIQAKLEKELELEQLRLRYNPPEASCVRNDTLASIQYPMNYPASPFYNPYMNYPILNYPQQPLLNMVPNPNPSLANVGQQSVADGSSPSNNSPQQNNSQLSIKTPVLRPLSDRGLPIRSIEEIVMSDKAESLSQKPEPKQEQQEEQEELKFEPSNSLKVESPEMSSSIKKKMSLSMPEEKLASPKIEIHAASNQLPLIRIYSTEDEEITHNQATNNLGVRIIENERKRPSTPKPTTQFPGAANPISISINQKDFNPEPQPLDFTQGANMINVDQRRTSKDKNIGIIDQIIVEKEESKTSSEPQGQSNVVKNLNNVFQLSKAPPRKKGKYYEPSSRVFKLDFSKLEKKLGAGEEEARGKAAPEKKIPVLTVQPKLQAQARTSLILSKPNPLQPKLESYTTLTSMKLSENSPSLQPHTLNLKGISQTDSKNEPGRLITSMSSMNNTFTNQLIGSQSKIKGESSLSKFDTEGHETIMRSNGSTNLPNGNLIEHSEVAISKLNLVRDQSVSLSSLLDSLKIPKRLSIRKQINVPEDSLKYLVECQIDNEGAEPTLKMILMQEALTSSQFLLLSEEKLRFRQVHRLLEQIEYRDVLPTHMSLRSISSMESFIQHLIMPFIGVNRVFCG